MGRKRPTGASIGFSNHRFLEALTALTGVVPVGDLGRETPLDLTSLEAARGSLLLGEIFSKFDDGTPSDDKVKNSWERFHEAEALCKETNYHIPRTMKYDPFWMGVRARLRMVLGSFCWDLAAKRFGFGPGATTRLTRKHAAACYKYSGIPESTLGNVTAGSCAIRMSPLWTRNVLESGGSLDNLVKVVPGNHVIFVPKNYKTDRSIAKEPDMNIYIQKGIGQLIRARLKSVGIDLRTQERNQEAALIGSLTGELATIDLSMASDTLAFELVSYLLPNDWWYALEQCRSPVGVLPSGEQLRYQKFSSMGNGYTFELETLIFWAIAQQVLSPLIRNRDRRVLVYGDDIVFPTAETPVLLRRLKEAGFRPNPKKTWYTGPYRESCGKHYFLGTDITPFYVRKPVDRLHRLFLVHNNLSRWLDQCRIEGKEVLTRLRQLAPAHWREPRLPDGFGDGAFIGAVDELRRDSHPYGWDKWQIRVLAQSQLELADDLPHGQLIASLLANERYKEDSELQRCRLVESLSGLPAREGGYIETVIDIERRPRAT
jgi:hypothetical protein